MGGSSSQAANTLGLVKGQGYRIISVKPNSPLDHLVDPYFDFIIDAVPLSSSEPAQKTPKEILSKLTEETKQATEKELKPLERLGRENEGKVLTLRVLSTKYRSVRDIEVIPNRNWNGSDDLMGLEVRVFKYDLAFGEYRQILNVKPNSPFQKAGILEEEYLIGCQEFDYSSVGDLLEKLYERFYDKSIEDKKVNFAVYDIIDDDLRIVEVHLSKDWGGKGLLGCEFLEGILYRFPTNFEEHRKQQIQEMKRIVKTQATKKQLSESSGASVHLVKALKTGHKNKRRMIQSLKQIASIVPTKIQPEEVMQQPESLDSQPDAAVNIGEFEQLEDRVNALERILLDLKQHMKELLDRQAGER